MATASTHDQAQSSPAPWTADDVVMSEQADDVRISPDGRRAVWVKSEPDKDKDQHVSHLYLSSLAEQQQIRLTREGERNDTPRWSPDGRHVAFISTRPLPKQKRPSAPPAGEEKKPKPQIWLISPAGGESWPLTSGERGVESYEWATAETIVFCAQEEPSLYERTIKEDKDTSVVVEDEAHEPPVRLFKATLDGDTVTRLTENADRIRSLAVSPDGRWAVTIHERSLSYVYDQKVQPVVYLYDVESGEGRQILADPAFHVRQAFWAPDSRGFYVVSAFSSHPQYLMATIDLLYYVDLASGEAAAIDLDWEKGLAFSAQGLAVAGDGFIALLADGVRHRAARYRREGEAWQRAWLEGEHVQNTFRICLAQDGQTLLYAHSTGSTPTQWYRAQIDGAQVRSPVQWTSLNAHLAHKPMARTEVIRWQGALDQEIEGLLSYPHDYEPGRPYPLVVLIHGGPAGADLDAWSESWSRPLNLMNARGALVLRANYHGSAYYGLAWVESIGDGRYYDLEVPDIEKGVDALIERGWVDRERLGVMGWSNGGILTIALTVSTTRYKAASAGAGDVDWTSDWGNCAFGAAFDHYYLGASPFQDPERYIHKSPFYHLDRVCTPTIIFFGEQDTSVPTQQGWMHYRALQQSGQADVRFVLFPGEKHSLQKLSHQRRKLQEELAWFDRHLFQTAQPESSLKPGSPLARALKLQGLKPDGRRYGRLVPQAGTAPDAHRSRDILIPETVAYQGLEIGRFEVTRAQYAEFDPGYPLAAGTANYPANGISFEQAQAYCAWLSAQTGEHYRLGTQAELEALYKVEERAENTLDYWASYPLNPEDAASLRQEIEKLGEDAPLLKEVGSFEGTDTPEPVFDLGGSVAEWAAGPEGRGCVLGGSADTPADPRARQRSPAPAYVGFRVVKDQAEGRAAAP
jgi:dipeptidyl aminopeptidase/acylaminoacyl peptidase